MVFFQYSSFCKSPVLCFFKVATYISDGYIFSHNRQYVSFINVSVGTIWKCLYSNIRKDRLYNVDNREKFYLLFKA